MTKPIKVDINLEHPLDLGLKIKLDGEETTLGGLIELAAAMRIEVNTIRAIVRADKAAEGSDDWAKIDKWYDSLPADRQTGGNMTLVLIRETIAGRFEIDE